MINLLSWSEARYLNSHTVAAPVSKGLHEVTGYINHDVGMEAEVINNLKLTKILATVILSSHGR